MTITGKDMDARNGGTDKALAERGERWMPPSSRSKSSSVRARS